MPATRKLFTALAGLTSVLLLSACQSLGHSAAYTGPVVAIYGSAADASAVSMGYFGARPTALVKPQEIEPATQCAADTSRYHQARCVRTRNGDLGWLPLERPAASSGPGQPVSQLDTLV